MKILYELEKIINYSFNNKLLLVNALTHTSFANENKNTKIYKSQKMNLNNNERLEFLGDSVLNLVITTHLFNRLSNTPEGDLSRIRASIVCEKSLREMAESISLNKFIFLGKGEEITGGRNRDSIIADASEALIGAIYLDSSLEEARRFIMKHMGNIIEKGVRGELFSDYKTQFQEMVQKGKDVKIEYKVVDEKGPDHNKVFTVKLFLDGSVISKGVGKTKKEAEQSAAKGAIFDIK